MKKLTIQQQKEALENAMLHFNFPKKYFIHSMNGGGNKHFILASKNDQGQGGINTHSVVMTYEEFNCYLKGWYDAKMNKY